MTDYNTCAYPGCTRRIAYDPKRDWQVPRYCEEHAGTMEDRIRKAGVESDKQVQSALFRPVGGRE